MDTRHDIDDPDGDIYERRERRGQHQKTIRGWSGAKVFTVDGGGSEELSVQAEFKQIGYYTVQVQFSIPSAVDDLGLPIYSIKGELECIWSVAGNNIRRVCHVANGSSISGLGESVSINLLNLSLRLNEFAPAAEFSASVSITPGTRPTFGGAQPPIYTPYDTLTSLAGATADIIIPTEVGAYCVYLMTTSPIPPIPADAVWSGQVSIDGTNVGSFGSPKFNEWVSIPPGCPLITFGSATVDLSVYPIFGIEG